MATYDLTSSIPTKIAAGDILNCPYSGTYKTVTLSKGTYKLECWGAQGGNNKTGAIGGKGGYSEGTLTLAQATVVYIYTGQKGVTNSTVRSLSNSAFNGGGKGSVGTASYANGSGGGASDIRIGQDSLYTRVIVAGGGGGAGANASYSSYGGYAGGTSGGTGYNNGSSGSVTRAGKGGTQTAGGATGSSYTDYGTAGTFGGGGDMTPSGTSYYAGGGGGAGWYGGGSSTGNGASGGGGSSYVYTSATASNYPSGCLLDSSMYLTNANTIAGNASMPSTSGSIETGHEGNGYVRITVIKVNSIPFRMKVNGSIVEASEGYVKVNGTWKEIIGVHHKSNGEWSS